MFVTSSHNDAVVLEDDNLTRINDVDDQEMNNRVASLLPLCTHKTSKDLGIQDTALEWELYDRPQCSW